MPSVRAFSLIELLVVIAVIALLVSILLPALSQARAAGRKAVCTSNLHQFAVAMTTYGSDYRDLIASFSWKPGGGYSRWSELNPPAGSSQMLRQRAGALQATDIARRLTDRDDLKEPSQWMPQAFYTHLVINDYLAQRLPEPMVACPADASRVDWQKRSLAGDFFAPASSDDWRWAYSSSYLFVPAAWSADQAKRGTGFFLNENTVAPSDISHLYVDPGHLPYGGRKQHEVLFPSQKVAMMDTIGRHIKKDAYYAYDDVVQPLLFFDASVRDIRTADANVGGNPNDLDYNDPVWVKYEPYTLINEPPTRSGETSEYIIGRYQWTRRGLKGVDVAGQERLNPKQ